MKRHAGGEPVSGGYYWSLARWEIVPVREETGALPGPATESYWSLPLPLIPLVVALMAVLCVFYVPAIGFGMVGWALWKKALGRERAPAKPADVKDASAVKADQLKAE